jgi:hypothetical protein
VRGAMFVRQVASDASDFSRRWHGWGFWDEAKNYRKVFMHLRPVGMTK